MSEKIKIFLLCLTLLVLFSGWVAIVRFVKTLSISSAKSGGEKIEVSKKDDYKAKVAIVLDDFGYNLNNLDNLFALKVPVTLSILPNLPYSEEIALRAAENKYEYILHLPLEPHADSDASYEGMPLEGDTILCTMSEEEIIGILTRALKSLPQCIGVSSHMGSKATENKFVIDAVFNQLKKKRLFFLDSLVTPQSVCKERASYWKIRFAERDVFLDGNDDISYIKDQIRQVIETAKKQGYAIAIGHDRPKTVTALEEMLDVFEIEEVKLVNLSNLVREP